MFYKTGRGEGEGDRQETQEGDDRKEVTKAFSDLSSVSMAVIEKLEPCYLESMSLQIKGSKNRLSKHLPNQEC